MLEHSNVNTVTPIHHHAIPLMSCRHLGSKAHQDVPERVTVQSLRSLVVTLREVFMGVRVKL